MYFQVNCDRPLGDIYGETMELIEVSFCVNGARMLLILNSISSLRSAMIERVLELSTTTKDPRVDESTLLGGRERLRNCVLHDR